MAKKSKGITALKWLESASDKQLERMRSALAIRAAKVTVPEVLKEIGDIDFAYAIVTDKRDGNLFRLVKLGVKDLAISSAEIGEPNLRAVLLTEIEDHILRNA